jgi:hypothetical protein
VGSNPAWRALKEAGIACTFLSLAGRPKSSGEAGDKEGTKRTGFRAVVATLKQALAENPELARRTRAALAIALAGRRCYGWHCCAA